MHKSRNTVRANLNAYFTIEPNPENILEGQTKTLKASIMSEDSCILEPELTVDDKLEVLIARGLVTPAS